LPHQRPPGRLHPHPGHTLWLRLRPESAPVAQKRRRGHLRGRWCGTGDQRGGIGGTAMHKIMLSYPLFGRSMERLMAETDLFVSNSGELAPFLPQLQAAEAFITRNVHPTTEMLDRKSVV